MTDVTVYHLLDGRVHCGASLVTRTLVQALRAAGADVRLLCLYEGAAAEAARRQGLDVQLVPGHSAPSRWRGIVRLLRAAWTAHGRPILHSHQLRANRFAALASARAGAAHVISVHTHKEDFIRDWFRNPVTRQIVRRIHYWTLNHAAARIAISPGVLRELVARGYTDGDTRLIRNLAPLPALPPNPADIRRAVRAELNLPEDAFIVLAAGRFVPLKRFDMLLKGLVTLAGLRKDATVVLAGDGPLRGELERSATELGVAGRVRFLGWRHDLQPYITACDCAVSCSQTECSPVFLIEAMSLARPVVAAAAEDVANLVSNGATGLLFPLNDTAEMCKAVAGVMRDPETAQRLGLAARAHIEEVFNPEETVRQMLELYARLAHTTGRAYHA
jgi:glycosyltransferase involved in cell wall biosynthesis